MKRGTKKDSLVVYNYTQKQIFITVLDSDPRAIFKRVDYSVSNGQGIDLSIIGLTGKKKGTK